MPSGTPGGHLGAHVPLDAGAKMRQPSEVPKALLVSQIVVILMLVWAIWPGNPYQYYTLLRWMCFAVFGYAAIVAYNRGMNGWAWVLAIIALLYNPFAPVRLNRIIWTFLNIATIGVNITGMYLFCRSRISKSDGGNVT